MKTIKYFFTALVALFVLNACNNDDEDIVIQKTKLTINFSTPDGVEITDYENVKIKFTETGTNITTEEKVSGNSITVDLRQGNYDINVSGNISYTFNGEVKKGSANASVKQVKLDKSTKTEDILLSIGSTQGAEGSQVNSTFLKLNFIAPKGIEITAYKDAKIKFKEINTNIETEKSISGKPLEIELPQGSYEISIDGNVVYNFEGNSLESGIGAFISQISLAKDSETTDIQLSLRSNQKDLIIEEIFFAGTRTPQGAYYVDDDYFKIHNNTDKVLYADGLIIVQSKFQTSDKQDFNPNIMNEAFAGDAMIQIPGNGTDYPIQPGESFIVANQAINHKTNNSNSFDLSKAKFEYFYEDSDDVDNPSVPNMINFREKMVLNQQGVNGFVIFRLPENMTKEQYLANYKYDYSYVYHYPGGSFESSESAYKIPNKWIVDAVNISNKDEFQWIITDPSLDKGWASIGYNSGSRYGKSIKRKVIQENNGKKFLQDTNNSTIDFEESNPSVSNY
ncbi:DUF4876 domain-containing protein [Weeksellaceae bacterium TAE3-ERU29]|nr:DUF4876 domain-containing protein [Weeksellaceae bacterium TAE3-ERU29]